MPDTPARAAAGAADSRQAAPGSPLYGITLKVASTLIFTVMVALIKTVADRVPLGEVVFFRSFFAIFPIGLLLAWRGQLAGALRTRRLTGHFFRGLVGVSSMFLWFGAISRLPLPEAMAIGYASPLIIVVLAALVLGEAVRLYRWSAVGVGFAGVLIILWPQLGALEAALGSERAAGALAALGSAFTAALAMILVRRLIATEPTSSIVIIFSISASLLALCTLPFGWIWPSRGEAGVLILAGLLGGVGQILMTESYRHADASTIATFDYSSMVWGLALAWLMFAEVPDGFTVVGSLIVIGAGLFIIWRERRLGLARPPSGPVR